MILETELELAIWDYVRTVFQPKYAYTVII